MPTPLTVVAERAANVLDISIAEQERAIARYEDLGNWLNSEHGGRAEVRVYAQGSFRLGTVVRPVDFGGDFDIDLVFLRRLARISITQRDLKEQAGAQLLK